MSFIDDAVNSAKELLGMGEDAANTASEAMTNVSEMVWDKASELTEIAWDKIEEVQATVSDAMDWEIELPEVDAEEVVEAGEEMVEEVEEEIA